MKKLLHLLTSLLFVVFIFLLPLSCKSPSVMTHNDTEEWIPLFNGKDLSDWIIKIAGRGLNENFRNTFVVEEGMIRIKYGQYEEFEDYYGHMYYKTPFSYYKIKFDYRFTGEQTKGGATWNVRNSGLMFHSQSAESNDYGQDFPVSIELQLLGGLGERDRNTANVCTPGTAVERNGKVDYTHCISSSSETYHGDQWVHSEAIVLGGEKMIFLVERDTVLTFEHPQIGGGFISNANDRDDWNEFGVLEDKEDWLSKDGQVLTEGYIALQAESHPIDFKNIFLLDLCGCMDKSAKNYKKYFVKHVPSKCKY